MAVKRTEEIVDRLRKLRHGGKVRRCHNIPHHGEYTVASHSHGVLTLLYVLWSSGEPPMRLVKACHFHDVAEGFVGDVPVVAKWCSTQIQEGYDSLELRVNHALGLQFMSELGTEEREWLSALDKLELWLWGVDQVKLGNDHVKDMMRALEGWFDDTDVPDEVRAFFENYEWRSPDVMEVLNHGTGT